MSIFCSARRGSQKAHGKEEITRKESEGTAEMGYLNESNISQGLSQNRECVKNMVIE